MESIVHLPVFAPIVSVWPATPSGSFAKDQKQADSIRLQSRVQLDSDETYTCHLLSSARASPILTDMRVLGVHASGGQELDSSLISHSIETAGIKITVRPSAGPVIADLSFIAPYNADVERLADRAQPFHFPWSLKLTPASFNVEANDSQPVSANSLSLQVVSPEAHRVHLKSEF